MGRRTPQEGLLDTEKKQDSNKKKEASLNIPGDVIEDALILALNKKLEFWVLNFGMPIHTTTNKECFKNYVQGDYNKVYLVDDKVYNIVGKGDVRLSLPT